MKRLEEIILHSDTEYAEFLLGVLSLITGFWLCTPFYSIAAVGVSFACHPKLWGCMLLCAGLMKYIGVLRGKLGMRRASCAIAMLIWWFLAAGYIVPTPFPVCSPKHPLISTMLGLGLFNALIYVKLSLVRPR